MSPLTKLFGFLIKEPEPKDTEVVRSFVPPVNDDGAADISYMNTFGGIAAFQFDIDGSTKTENELINRYRDIANLADVDIAVEDIVSESIVYDKDEMAVSINFIGCEEPDDDDETEDPNQIDLADDLDDDENPATGLKNDDPDAKGSNEQPDDAFPAGKKKKKPGDLKEDFPPKKANPEDEETDPDDEDSGMPPAFAKKTNPFGKESADKPPKEKKEPPKIPENLRKKIEEEFKTILRLMSFKSKGHDIFKRWYIDGRLYYHILIDEKSPKDGIKELRFVDPRKLKKVRENRSMLNKKNKKKDEFDLPFKENFLEYYLYSDQFFTGNNNSSNSGLVGSRTQNNNNNVKALKIAADSIASTTSGIIDSRTNIMLGFLHKAIRPANHLKMMEDALVIYRLTRAPEKRIFNIDIQDLPRGRSEQYVREFMNRFRNKISYDAETGEVRDQKRVVSMIEDFFIPRRNGTTGSSIEILPGGQNLGQIEDVEYFMKKLYNALNVPQSRLNPDQTYSFGRIGEVTREEVAYSQFIDKLRSRFSMMFDDLLKKQLILKNIIKPEEWEEINQYIKYDYIRNNYFAEMKESEVLKERLSLLSQVAPYEYRFFDDEFILRKILRFNDNEVKAVKEMRKKHPLPPMGQDPMMGGMPPGMDPTMGGGLPPGMDGGMGDDQQGNDGMPPGGTGAGQTFGGNGGGGGKRPTQEDSTESNEKLDQLLTALTEEIRQRNSTEFL